MLDINFTWIFPDLPVGEYEIVIAQKVGSQTLLNAYVHTQIHQETSAREQYVAIEWSYDEIVCSRKYLLCIISSIHIMEIAAY